MLGKIWQRMQDAITNRGGGQPELSQAESDKVVACCSSEVHIAFRGVSDNKLYVAKNRHWQEVRFYKPNGLRVFCVQCRHRVL